MQDINPRQVIESGSWFQGLPGSALDQLAAAAVIRELPVLSYIYEQGLPTREICCLLSGRVRVSISSPNGQEFALVDHEQGTWLGLPALMGDQQRVIDARVIESSRLLVLPREVVLAVGDEHPVMYRNLFYHNQEMLRGLHVLMAGILFYPLRSRVAGRLLDFARDHGKDTAEGLLLDIKISQSEFARLSLGSRQRVNKVFREWSERGIVITRDEYLLIPSIENLEGEISLFE
ncbi:Crp/Fnr family transcriptional regulator [Pseudohalioglobus sediminis]|uniref:Crp/Fnr family transcriptional regulator n=1 Tax=Pseudohalioglobus sediminis TaxID=2606449 RepID=A0A5B0X509_9GAMM|nr:Crp/Fnr family transcriptional regulator [Pseudohalioglobus sediminis]KAA1194323.1 Crp/Fnr family transcriptional regulator [Pseudohalioglobus sediminis]